MKIESAEISLADVAIMMRIRAAKSATNPTFGHACLFQCCHKQIFKVMWHPIMNSLKKNVIFYLALPMVLGLSTVFTHLKSFRMFYDHQIAVRELKGLHTSYRISYGPT